MNNRIIIAIIAVIMSTAFACTIVAIAVINSHTTKATAKVEEPYIPRVGQIVDYGEETMKLTVYLEDKTVLVDCDWDRMRDFVYWTEKKRERKEREKWEEQQEKEKKWEKELSQPKEQ